MEYITVKEAGEKWGLGIRMVTLYCKEGRIVGVVKKGNMWLIPADAPKPEDRRRKKASIQAEQEAAAGRYNDVYEPSQQEDHWPFQSLYENKDLFAEIVKHFPYPMHICAPDGTMLLANEAYLKFAKISNPERLYKKHNILQNSNLERWGIKDFTVRAFQGKAVYAFDVKVPYQEIVYRLGDDKEIVCESIYHNMTALPIRDSHNQLLFIVFIFITSRALKIASVSEPKIALKAWFTPYPTVLPIMPLPNLSSAQPPYPPPNRASGGKDIISILMSPSGASSASAVIGSWVMIKAIISSSAKILFTFRTLIPPNFDV
jgi:hypothetical protein